MLRQLASKLARRRKTPFQHLKPEDFEGQPTSPLFSPSHLLKWPGETEALFYPPMVAADDVEASPDGLALGVERNAEARVYPLTSLWRHHVVNDSFAGQPLLVTFCGKCFSGVAFDPTVDGQVLRFEGFGMYQGNSALRDRETGTIWAQLTGEGLVGPLAGRRLPLWPVELTTWKDWLGGHPHSLTPDPHVLLEGHVVRPGELRLHEPGRSTVSAWDVRLSPDAWVLGVDVEYRALAYVLDVREPGPRLGQDVVGEVPLALLAPANEWPLAYDRRTPHGVVDLRLAGDRIVDNEGTVWTGNGHAVEGPRAGSTLEFVPSRLCHWYAWAAANRETEIRTLDAGHG